MEGWGGGANAVGAGRAGGGKEELSGFEHPDLCSQTSRGWGGRLWKSTLHTMHPDPAPGRPVGAGGSPTDRGSQPYAAPAASPLLWEVPLWLCPTGQGSCLHFAGLEVLTGSSSILGPAFQLCACSMGGSLDGPPGSVDGHL